MEATPRVALVILVMSVWLLAARADDYPFSAIADMPERQLIGVDKYGFPHIADKDKARVALIAVSKTSPSALRSVAVKGLAISGYSSESVDALIKVLTEEANTDRTDAAMGLRNFTPQLPKKRKRELRVNLRELVKAEGVETSDEIIRTLLAWGDAPWIVKQFGDDLTGRQMEIEILQQLPADRATPRLLEIYRKSEREPTSVSYNRRADIGRALLHYRDKRGVDILDTLLDASSVPMHEGAPNHQYRHNVFTAIQKAIGKKFGYEHLNYDPTLDEVILRFREWWFHDRYEFEFPKR